ncbi:hypothetical protein NDU88_004505, partial [Pleurodeles waltl]
HACALVPAEMAGSARVLEAFSGLIQRERLGAALPGVLQGARDTGGLRGTQNSSVIGSLVGISNARLSSVKTRFEGLCLLSLLVSECPTDHFQQNCVAWLRSIQHTIQAQDSAQTTELAVFILHDLLKYSSLLPELAREISMNHIPGILTSLLGLKLECQTAALKGMKACMNFYPRACGSLRAKLASCFLSLLDVESPHLQQLACDCYTHLPSLGSGFSHGMKYRECWEHQLHTLLATLHGIVGNLYEGCETDPVLYEGPGLELELPKTDNLNSNVFLHLKNRFTAISKCICLLLSSDFSAPVSVPVQDILDVVCRVLNISNRNLSWLGDGPLKMLILPTIHMAVLDMLCALILACGARLVRFASVMCRLFSQVLTGWSMFHDSAVPGQEKPYSAVRTKTYCVLELWLKVCGASSGVLQGSTHHSDVLLAHLLADITPSAETIKLKGGHVGADITGSSGKPASKKQKMGDMEDSSELQSHRKHDANANSDVCSGALKVLSRAILLSGSLIKEETHRKLHEMVVPLLIHLQQSMGPMSSPYSSAECRKELYRLLLCLLLAPNPRLPPPLHCAVRLFSLGQAEKNTEVLSFCAEAMVISSCLIHPRVPSLQIPVVSSGISSADLHKLPTQGPPQVQSPFRHSVPTPLPIPPSSPHPQSNHIGLPLQGNSMISRLPPSMLQAPVMPPCTVATENHNSVPHLGGDPLLQDMQSPTEELFGGKAHRPLFIHYDKEEASDVEISLESDSDDSVVIVPEGLLSKPPEALIPTKGPEEVEEAATEATVVPITAASLDISVPPPVLAPVLPPPPALSVPTPQQATESPAATLEEDLTVININSSDDEEEDEEDYPEDDEFFDEEEDYDEEFDEELEEEEEGEEGDVEEVEDMEDEEELEEDYEGEDEEIMTEEEEDDLPQDMTSEMDNAQTDLELKAERVHAVARAALQQRAAAQQRAVHEQGAEHEQRDEHEQRAELQQQAELVQRTEQEQRTLQVQQAGQEQQAGKEGDTAQEQQVEREQARLDQEVEQEQARLDQQVEQEQAGLEQQAELEEQIKEQTVYEQQVGQNQQVEQLELANQKQVAEREEQTEQEELAEQEEQAEPEEQSEPEVAADLSQKAEVEPSVNLQQKTEVEEMTAVQEEVLQEKADLQGKVEVQHELVEQKAVLLQEEIPRTVEAQQEEILQKAGPELMVALPIAEPEPLPLVLEKQTSKLEVMEVENADEPEAVDKRDEAPPHLSPVREKDEDEEEPDQDDEPEHEDDAYDDDDEPEVHEGDTDLFMTVESDGGEKMPGEEDEEDMERDEPPTLPKEMEKNAPIVEKSSRQPIARASPLPLPMDQEAPNLEPEPKNSQQSSETRVGDRDRGKESAHELKA